MPHPPLADPMAPNYLREALWNQSSRSCNDAPVRQIPPCQRGRVLTEYAPFKSLNESGEIGQPESFNHEQNQSCTVRLGPHRN